MGYTTDFIGHVAIEPALNEAEQHYLLAFNESRRCQRPGGPYEIPGNPAAEHDEHPDDIAAYNSIAKAQPSLWCGWKPCWDGCCLAHDGVEKFYSATNWMAYLIDHFLSSKALVRTSGLSCFDDFTFDHTLNGIIAGCQRDTRDLYLIHVEDNEVSRELLWRPRDIDPRLLPYEAVLDDARQRRGRRRKGVGNA